MLIFFGDDKKLQNVGSWMKWNAKRPEVIDVMEIINEYYTAFGIKDGDLYSIGYVEGELTLKLIDSGNWEYVTGVYYSATYMAFGIKEQVLYTLGDIARRRIEILERLTKEGVINLNKELEIFSILPIKSICFNIILFDFILL